MKLEATTAGKQQWNHTPSFPWFVGSVYSLTKKIRWSTPKWSVGYENQWLVYMFVILERVQQWMKRCVLLWYSLISPVIVQYDKSLISSLSQMVSRCCHCITESQVKFGSIALVWIVGQFCAHQTQLSRIHNPSKWNCNDYKDSPKCIVAVCVSFHLWRHHCW